MQRLLGGLIFIAIAALPAMAGGQAPSAPIDAASNASSMHGVVVNAVSKQPVGRALVQVGSHSILTGHDGKFEFSDLAATDNTVRVTKPGFYDGLDPIQTATKFVAAGSQDEVQVLLYPEALVTGTVSLPNGDPVPQMRVQALRRIDDDTGSRWAMGGQTSSNADGEFRLTLPGGEYVLQTQYLPDRPGAHGAILPMILPAAGSGGASNGSVSTLRLASGSEQHVELHPTMRLVHAVHLLIDSAGSPSATQTAGQNPAQIQAHLANGLVFSPMAGKADKPGEVVVSLPNGTYLLSATANNGEEPASYGETKVTVADEDVTGLTIHLQKAVELTIEISADAASEAAPASASAPGLSSDSDDSSVSRARQLGLFLQRTNSGVSLMNENIYPSIRRGERLTFSLLPGSYRLRSMGYGSWFVASATAGGTDLLTRDLIVNGGSSALSLRLLISDRTATVKGTVRRGDPVSAATVYLIATAPTTTPVISARSGPDGSFSRGPVRPGTYRVLASESRLALDLTDPAAQREFAPYLKTITVAAGETGSVDLDAVRASELKP